MPEAGVEDSLSEGDSAGDAEAEDGESKPPDSGAKCSGGSGARGAGTAGGGTVNPAKGLAPMPGFVGVGIHGGVPETGGADAGTCGAEGAACTDASGANGPEPGAEGEPPDQRGLDGCDGDGGVGPGAGIPGANGETFPGLAGRDALAVPAKSNGAGTFGEPGPGPGPGPGGVPPDAGEGAPKAMDENDAADAGAKGLGTPGATAGGPDSGPLPTRPNDAAAGGAGVGADAGVGSGFDSDMGAPKLNGDGRNRVVAVSVSSAVVSVWTKGENRLWCGCLPGKPGADSAGAMAKGEAPVPGAPETGPFGINEAILCGGMATERMSSGEIGAGNRAGQTR